jgi:hypothetical protein
VARTSITDQAKLFPRSEGLRLAISAAAPALSAVTYLLLAAARRADAAIPLQEIFSCARHSACVGEIKRYEHDPQTLLAPPSLPAVHRLGKSPSPTFSITSRSVPRRSSFDQSCVVSRPS